MRYQTQQGEYLVKQIKERFSFQLKSAVEVVENPEAPSGKLTVIFFDHPTEFEESLGQEFYDFYEAETLRILRRIDALLNPSMLPSRPRGS